MGGGFKNGQRQWVDITNYSTCFVYFASYCWHYLVLSVKPMEIKKESYTESVADSLQLYLEA